MGRFAVVLAILVVLFQTPALARGKESVRSISVSGTAETQVAPDHAVWSITLVDTDKNIKAAKARNDEKLKSLMALRERLGLAEGDFEAGNLGISREFERDERGNPVEFRHFAVRRHVRIRQWDLARLDEFADALLASSEMEVGFGLESSRVLEVRAETRLRALQAAKDKAAAMALVAGAKLGRVLTIEEYPKNGPAYSPFANAIGIEAASVLDVASEQFVPGGIPVKVTVYATFELE